MKEKTITVSHEVSPEYGKCSFGGDFWGQEVCKYHALRTQTHGNKAPPEYRKPKCLLFNCWLDEPYQKVRDVPQGVRGGGQEVKEEIRARCPLCGGEIIVSEYYQTSRDYKVLMNGKLSKRYIVTEPVPLNSDD